MLSKVLILVLVSAIVTGSQWEKEEEKHNDPKPYRFGYEVKDKEGTQYRHEEADGSGTVRGSYGYTDEKGVYREVNYVADKNGFRAKVKTNEPGTANQDPADVKIEADPQIQEIHGHKVIPEIVPVYHKVDIPSYASTKQYHNTNKKSYNFDNFSPLHGYSYRPSQNNFKPLLNLGNSYRQNSQKQVGGYQFQVPHYRNLQGLGGFGKLDGFSGSKDDEIEKLIEEAKNIRGYSSDLKGFSDNAFDFKEFRNLDSQKSLFSNDYLNNDYNRNY